MDGRIGWVGGAGIEDHFEDGRFHDLFVRLTGPVVSQFQLVFVASLRWLGGELDGIDALFPDVSRRRHSRESCCTTRRGATGRSPTRSRACSTAPGRRSTSSTPTSRTAG